MLDNIFHHANIIKDKDVFEEIKQELMSKNIETLSFLYDESIDGGKNLHIEEVRNISEFVNIKTINKRYILISKKIANTIIQNSLLKLLEEAKENICFIFFIENTNFLLPTVLSRVFVFDGSDKKASTNILLENFKNKVDRLIKKQNFKDLEKAYLIRDYYLKGALPEKNFESYLNLL